MYKDDFNKCKIQIKKLTKTDLNEITDIYTEWRDTIEVMPLRLIYKQAAYLDLTNTAASADKWIECYNMNTGKIAVRFNDISDIVCYEKEVPEWSCIKSCKRGNDVYIKQVKKKFKPVIDIAKNKKSFFSTTLNKNRKRVRKTKLLYITGTCDSSITGTIGSSWLKFGDYWNSFITNVREQFGGGVYIRAWQSQKNGFPHFHALVYFPNFEFSVTPWFNKTKQKYEFRIHNRQKHNGKYVREKLKDSWKWGHLDILAVDSVKKGLTDLVKYITRDLEGGESNLTNAMAWYFGRQTYSISKNFVKELLGKDIELAEPTNDDLINAKGVIQRSNSKKNLIRIEVFPIIRADLIPKNPQKTLDFDDKNKDPPPEKIDFLERMALDCKPTKMSYNDDGVQIVVYDFKE